MNWALIIVNLMLASGNAMLFKYPWHAFACGFNVACAVAIFFLEIAG